MAPHATVDGCVARCVLSTLARSSELRKSKYTWEGKWWWGGGVAEEEVGVDLSKTHCMHKCAIKCASEKLF